MYLGCYRPFGATDTENVVIFTNSRVLSIEGPVKDSKPPADLKDVLDVAAGTVFGLSRGTRFRELPWTAVARVDASGSYVRLFDNASKVRMVMQANTPSAAVTLAEAVERARREAQWQM